MNYAKDENLALLQSSKRLAALRRTQLLDSKPEPEFDRLTKFGARLLRAPMCLVSLVDENRQFFKSQCGLGEPWSTLRETKLTASICQYVLANPLIVIEDVRDIEEFKRLTGLPELQVRSYIGASLQLEAGEPLGAFCVLDHVPRKWTQEDIENVKALARSVETEIQLKLALASANEAKETAERASNEKSGFIAMMNHELRTPLTSILGFTRLLKSDRYNDEQKSRWQDRIERNGEHMLNVVNSTLDIAQIEAGVFECRAESIELRELAKESLAMFSFLEAEGRLSVSVDFDANCPTHFFGDSLRIQQILANVVGNAAKYSDKVLLQVSYSGENLTFAIEDYGPGIDQALVKNLFEPFRQGESGTVRMRSSGLGLNISRKLARQMGGDLYYEMPPTKRSGARFVLRLPFSRAETAPVPLRSLIDENEK